MTKFATIVIPFAYTPIWIQTCIASFKAVKNSFDAEIMVIDNSETDRRGLDIRALTETSLGEGVKVIPQGKRFEDGRYYTSHASALDYAIGFIETPYMFVTESDVTADRDGWLDWFASRLRDEAVAMVGWFWPGRKYINPSHTLLNMRILRMIEAEVRNNRETIFVWGKGYARRFEREHWKWLIENGFLGPFSEVRGFLSNEDGIPDDWWQRTHDTGSWLYYRLSNQYECARVPGEEIPVPNWKSLGCNPSRQYVGDSEAQAYMRHHQAGTVSHDYEKHLVMVEWQSHCLEGWLRREYRLWEEIVPEFIRRESLEKGLIPPMDREIEKALKRLHIIKIGDKVRAYHYEGSSYITGVIPEPNIPGEGLNAEVVGHDPEEGVFVVRFDERPPDDEATNSARQAAYGNSNPYYKYREEGGRWYANLNPKNLIKR